MPSRVVSCVLLLGWWTLLTAGKPAKKEKKTTGSQKCPKGIFGSLVKDAAIPLCDSHYPDDKAKSSWLVLFYRKELDGDTLGAKVKESLNRVAIDLGNEPPEKSKTLKKPSKKQRARIKDLAEKYEFDAKIPKKGLEDKGKEALLKVGAVCCNCDADEQKLCAGKEDGIRLVRPGEEERVMPGGEAGAGDSDQLMKWTMGQLGFIKGAEPDAPVAKSSGGGETAKASTGETTADLTQKIEDLKKQKKQATADEDYTLAGKLKKQISEFEERLKSSGSAGEAEDSVALQKKVEELKEQKKKATADEDYGLAGKLKKEISLLEERIKVAPKVEDKATLEAKLTELKEKKKKATADEDYDLAGQLKKEVVDIENRIKKTEL